MTSAAPTTITAAAANCERSRRERGIARMPAAAANGTTPRVSTQPARKGRLDLRRCGDSRMTIVAVMGTELSAIAIAMASRLPVPNN